MPIHRDWERTLRDIGALKLPLQEIAPEPLLFRMKFELNGLGADCILISNIMKSGVLVIKPHA